MSETLTFRFYVKLQHVLLCKFAGAKTETDKAYTNALVLTV